MDADDVLVGRVLSRREVVRLLGLAGAGVVVGTGRRAPNDAAARSLPAQATPPGVVGAEDLAQQMPSCVVRPELMEGPYFLDASLTRSDIRAEPTTSVAREGAPLALAFAVSDVTGGRCAPLAGALVDVWQCDAAGAYSGFTDDRQGFKTEGQRWLRGQQVTDAKGLARFTTIYPGWYAGRAVHIHFKIRTPAAAGARAGSPATYEFTSQLFFDERLTDRVHAREPYARRGRRDTPNARDGIYRNGGDRLLLTAATEGDGYATTFAVGLDLADAAAGRSDGRRR